MQGLNKVMLIGRLGADPESRTVSSGKLTTKIRLATSKQWTDRNTGERTEATEWHTVNFWGRTAEVVAEYVRKGSLIYVEGEIRTRRWNDRNGQERFSTEVTAYQMHMLDSPRSGPAGDSNEPSPPPQPEKNFDDDIPF